MYFTKFFVVVESVILDRQNKTLHQIKETYQLMLKTLSYAEGIKVE